MAGSIFSVREDYVVESDDIVVLAEVKIWKFVTMLKSEVEKEGYAAFQARALKEMKRSILEDFERAEKE